MCFIWPGGRGGSACTDFNHRELPCYLSNTNEILPLVLKFLGEQVFIKEFCQGYNLLPWHYLIFDMFSQILTFLIFFLLINNFFKTIANSLSQSKKFDNFF